MTDSAGSSVPRRQLGRLLKEWRERAGKNLLDAAASIDKAKSTMYRIESGDSPITKLEVRELARQYGVPDELVPVFVTLAGETKAKGWWATFGAAMPPWFELMASMESAASHIRQFAVDIVPGLLQTEAYARAVLATNPSKVEDLDRSVKLRMSRQRILTRGEPRTPVLDVIIDEGALRRPLSNRADFREQLEHLAGAGAARNVHLRILPSAVGPHRQSGQGPFVILDFQADLGGRPEPTTIYCEGVTGGLYLDKEEEVALFEDVWAALADLALNAEESRVLIETIVKETEDD